MTLKFPSKLDMLCPSALLFLYCKARSFWGCTPTLLVSCPGVLAGPSREPSLVPIWISESNYFVLMSTDMENSMSLCTRYPIRPPIPLPAVMLASPGDLDSWR